MNAVATDVMAEARNPARAYLLYSRHWVEGMRPAPVKPMSQWSDENRFLPQKGASEHGLWRTDRMPHTRAIMDALGVDDPTEFVDLMKSTQSAGTEIILNFIGSVIAQSPGPMMVVQPTGTARKRFSKQRVQPMIDISPALRGRVEVARSRDSGNTMDLKEFAGGVLNLAIANSASDLSSMPVRFLAMDEVDKYPAKVGDESSPEDEAEARTTTYGRRRKIFAGCSPSLLGSSNIHQRYLRGTQEECFYPCPHCGHMDYFRDERLTDDGQFLCEGCGELIEELHKDWMLQRGEWHATNPKPEPRRRSFHVVSAMIPHGLGVNWVEIAEQRVRARGDPIREQNYYNKRWGVPYENKAGRIEVSELEKLRVPGFKQRTIPPGCLFLTAGVDVQINRFAVMILGHGRGDRCWPIDQVELPGSPTRREDWDMLLEFLKRPIVNSYGVEMRPVISAVDSGNWTHEVYSFARAHQSDGVIAIKGLSQRGKPVIGTAAGKDPTVRGRTLRRGLIVWNIGTDTAKQTLLGRLALDREAENVEERHVFLAEDAPVEMLQQLVSEQWDAVKREYTRIHGLRNEQLDCWVYGFAAAHHPSIRIHTMRDSDWTRLEAKVEPQVKDMFSQDATEKPKRRELPRGFGSDEWNL